MESWLPYIKPTQREHDSGFNCFEVGYCTIGKNNKTEEVRVIGTISDHIQIRAFAFLGDLPIESLNMDLTRDGYIRLFTFDEGTAKGCRLKWDPEEYPLSTMMLKLVRGK